MASLWKLDVHRDVQIAKWGLGGLLGIFLYCFIYFLGEIKDVRHDVAGVSSAIAGQSSTINGIDKTLSRIEDKLDKRNGDQSETSSNERKSGSTHN